MSASVDFTNADALQDYIREFMPSLITKMYHGFKTAALVTPLEGVKGQKVLTEMLLGTLVQRWAKTFDPTAAISFNPRTLTVYPAKVDIQIYPQEFEERYLGMARRPGFQPADLPYEAFILSEILKKVQAEQETAFWSAVYDSTPDAGDPLSELFNGILKIIVDELVIGSITSHATAAHTNSNAVGNAEIVHKGLAPVYQDEETFMFCSFAFARLYKENYRANYGQYTGWDKGPIDGMIKLDFGNCYLVPTIGMGTSSRLICTPASNILYGYDLASDSANIRVEQNHRSLDFMIDFKMGVQIGIVDNNILSVNDLT